MKFFLGFFLLLSPSLFAQKMSNVSKDTMAVYDIGDVLKNDQNQKLETEIKNYNDSGSVIIGIITVPGLQGYDLSEVSYNYFNEWRSNNDKRSSHGVFILVVKNGGKISIETGKAVKEVLSPDVIKQIINEKIRPYFANGSFYLGLKNGIDAIIEKVTVVENATGKS